MKERRISIPTFLIVMAVLFLLGLGLNIFAQEKPPRAAQVELVKNAIKRTDLRDEEFLQEGRKDVKALGEDLLKCWKELDQIKAVILERKP